MLTPPTVRRSLAAQEVTVPRPSPRFTADALQKHIERFLAAQQQQQQHQEQQQD